MSLRVLKMSSSAYRLLAVPVNVNKFWIRVYVRSNQKIGTGTVSDSQHVVWMGPADGAETSKKPVVEIANDCGLAFNANDNVKRPASSDPNCATPYSLAADEWHCIEAAFDGGTGNTQLYANGELVIDAPAWTNAKGNYTHFKFGVDTYGHEYDRDFWYDDLVVAPTRIECM
jgi:hypothetical protein